MPIVKETKKISVINGTQVKTDILDRLTEVGLGNILKQLYGVKDRFDGIELIFRKNDADEGAVEQFNIIIGADCCENHEDSGLEDSVELFVDEKSITEHYSSEDELSRIIDSFLF